ncbi:MAG: C39 family peptidase [Patescibacteria group bacterium]|jgi:hypothetical protein
MMNKVLKYLFLVSGLALIGLAAIRFMPSLKIEDDSEVIGEADRETGSSSVPVSTSSSTISLPSISLLPLSAASSSATSSIVLVAPASEVVASSAPVAIPKASSSSFIIPVPFTSQAPLGEWSDERQQDGCEEASVAMAMAWVNGEKNIAKEEWLARILALSDFEEEKYGEHRDVALADVVSWMFNDYFSYEKVAIKPVASSSDILKELERGNIVLIPTNGRALKNPNFKSPGPEEHMILIKGYDYKAEQFITNDPGTRLGENYRYSSAVIFSAIRPYETGYKLPFPKTLVREMIVVEK